MLTLCFHLQFFCLFVGTRVQLLECIFCFLSVLLSLIYLIRNRIDIDIRIIVLSAPTVKL